MAKRKRSVTPEIIEERIKEGRGQGRGVNYKPWLTIQDVASTGTCSRIKGWKTQRIHHLLSELELSYFYVLEWSLIVNDIREQYPLLPLTETQSIAEECGFRYPTIPGTDNPIIMTTDFVISTNSSLEIVEQARTLKYAWDLQSKRKLEKLEIERRYWQRRGINWGIVTEREIPKSLVKNVAWLHPFGSRTDLKDMSKWEINRINKILTEKIRYSRQSLAEITAQSDDLLGFIPGTSLSVARYLLANRTWDFDINQPIQPQEPLVLLKP
ncbi:TnsA endonuclease [Crinalium epipsammum PCC 9333]|uniref:TnsA endonuclease n=1 Tax=Crinalium epipsammum PCC 9333 TaxID=1173022 RepID=K9VU29_9CYAN|nr:heteromeric transposase endonuclease subunit TnsA [Crinalium epipsammum]AFZ11256.1 TnsA endonuclease [Crinalium epipsammum PCC 9333]AFZ11598.1 TnsA endonuclease [Crinalium epipsammum PCC 9333]